ncbi:MAG: NAD(P)H-hydrate epimerase [Planctomycetota bacterium]
MLTCNQSRAIDRIAIHHFGIPGVVLMENAARACTERLVDQIQNNSGVDFKDQAVVILCGPGNNGGDGFANARHLFQFEIPVKVILFHRPEKHTGDAEINLKIISKMPISILEFDEALAEADLERLLGFVGRRPTTWVVDSLLGTGSSGPPRPPMAKAIQIANRLPAKRMAIDIPTGIDGDSGQVAHSTFRADVTCTFVDLKPGLVHPDAKEFVGAIEKIGIGFPERLINRQKL